MTTIVIGSNTGNTAGLGDTGLTQQFPGSIQGAGSGNYLKADVVGRVSRMVYIPSGLPLIPAGVNVTSATLTLKNSDTMGSTRNVEVREVLTLVTESHASWNWRNVSNAWNVAGGLGGTDVASTVIATGLMPTDSNANFVITGAGLNTLVKAWIEGTKTAYGIIVNVVDDTTVFDGADRRIRTKESADTERPTLTIVYDTIVAPTVSVGDVTVSNVSGTATFTVTLSNTFASPVSINYATANQTATSGSDYRSASGTLTFAPGETSKIVTIDIINDGTITPFVVTNRAAANDTGVAPFAVQFDATGTTSTLTTRPFHELHHAWDFGDNDSVTWAYGTRAGVSKKNRASGPIAAHVYETPGTYTVQYAAIDPLTGAIAMTTKVITVTDPNVVFSGANTICIANGTLPVVGVNGVPAGATCYNETTWAGVISRIAAGKRVLLKKGDTWTTNASNTLTGAGTAGIIGAYGTGANPIVQLTLASSNVFSCTGSGNFVDWRIMDIDANATGLATGSARNATRFLNTPDGPTATSGRYATVLRCTHTSAGSFIYGSDSTTVADCVVTNLDGGAGNVGFWCYQRSNIAILGCNFDNATAAEHGVRFQGVSKMVFQSNRVFQPANTKHTLTLRGYSDAGAAYVWTGVYSEHCVLSGNEFLAGANNVMQVVTIKPQNGTSDERFRDIIFEKNYIEANVNYAYSFNIGGGIRITVRNNLTRLKTGSVGAILDNGSSWAGNGNAIIPPTDHAYYNNTTYASDTIAHGVDAIFVNTSTATGLLFYNNIAYTPAYSGTKKNLNITVGSTYTEATNSSNAQMGSTSPNFTATPPVTYTDWKPTSGYAVNGGTTVPVYDDFFGAQRTYPTADMGAVNPLT